MNRIHLWILSASLMSLNWLTGCNHAPRSQTSYGDCEACRAAAAARAQSTHFPIVAVEVIQGPNGEMIQVVPGTAESAIALPNSPTAIVNQPTAKTEIHAQAITVDGSSPQPPLPFPEEAANIKSVAMTVPSSNPALPAWTSAKEAPNTVPAPAPLPALSSTEIKATRIFSHSEDYRVLVGQVQSWRRGWRLRYADFSTEDQHGGSVVLEGGNVERLQEGSLIRVQGTLIPSTERAAPARFQVQAMEILNR